MNNITITKNNLFDIMKVIYNNLERKWKMELMFNEDIEDDMLDEYLKQAVQTNKSDLIKLSDLIDEKEKQWLL